MKKRIDTLLVDRGLAPSREKARALLMAGEVLVEGRPVTKPGVTVPEDAPLVLKDRLPYVGRGGVKLARALDAFGISVEDATALDVGASTGGFTDCLLQRGARCVYAVDVGRGQMDHRLRQDPRVAEIAVVEGGLAATGLRPRYFDDSPRRFQQLDRRKGDRRAVEIGQASHE